MQTRLKSFDGRYQAALGKEESSEGPAAFGLVTVFRAFSRMWEMPPTCCSNGGYATLFEHTKEEILKKGVYPYST